MAIISTDDPVVNDIIGRLLSTVIGQGGKVNKKIEFRCVEGTALVAAPKPNCGTALQQAVFTFIVDLH